MSTREALIKEIERQPEQLLLEVKHYLDYLIENRKQNGTPNNWPDGYFDKTAGAFADEQFERPSQLPMENRQEW